MADIATKTPPNAETDTLLSLYYSGNLLHAEKSCRELLARYPESALVFNILGMVFDAQGKDLPAIENYEKATQLKPDYADSSQQLGTPGRSCSKVSRSGSRRSRLRGRLQQSWCHASKPGSA